jgi:flagellar biosynthesis protein FliP
VKIFVPATGVAVLLLSFAAFPSFAADNDTAPLLSAPNSRFTQNFNDANPNPMQSNVSNDSETAVKQANPGTEIAPAESSELYKLIGVDASKPVEIVLLITIIAVAPSILLMMTCFTRIIIVFGFLRNAMQTQTTPPNQIMTGLALFLTIFIMWPTLLQVNEVAYKPYTNGELTAPQALVKASEPFKDFMLRQTSKKDMVFFLNLANRTIYENVTGANGANAGANGANGANRIQNSPVIAPNLGNAPVNAGTPANAGANADAETAPVTNGANAGANGANAGANGANAGANGANAGANPANPANTPATAPPKPVDLNSDGVTLENYRDQLGMEIVIPAFMISELSRAFQMGFMLFIPFLVIDIVVSSVLMSMGMMMLPPAMISLPFKIMMFVLVDGWKMLIGSIINSFN